MSDDPLNLEKWSFPAGNQLAPGETLLIWADDDTQQAGLHANFKLSGGGEQLFLTAPNGQTVIDAVTFGAQTEDVSIGRLFDGGSEWATLFAATPDASNEQGCGYRSFDQLNSNAHPISLTGTGSPAFGGAVQLTLQGLDPQESVLLAASKSADFNNQITSAGVVFLNIGTLMFQQSYTADAQGTVQVQLPIHNPALVGQVFYSQAYALNQGGSSALSNGVEIIICP